GKPVVVVKQLRSVRSQQRWNTLFPMGADNEDRVRFPELRGQLLHEIHHRLVARVSENRQGSRAMREVNDLSPFFGTVVFHAQLPLFRYALMSLYQLSEQSDYLNSS